MATVFEDRSTYDEKSDSVASITLKVECNPGQVADLSNFLVGVSSKAGVYSVSLDHSVEIPGVEDGEQVLQHADQEHRPAELGAGSEAAPSGEAGPVDAGADSVVAGPAGEVGAEPLGGSA